MMEAKNIYRSIVGNAKNSRSDKIILLISKVKELNIQILRTCIKATILPYEDAIYLIEYSQRTNAIVRELMEISKDYITYDYIM